MDILIDLTYGDNGKGRMVDYLSPDYDIVSRFNGGSNAGHVIWFNNIKYVFHLIPSGILQKKLCIIGNGCVVNINSFVKELKEIQSMINFNIFDFIVLSDKAHIITPVEIMFDIKKDKILNIGTTKSGNGIAYSRKALREGFRISDILHENFYNNFLKYVSQHKDDYYINNNDIEEFINNINFIKEFVKIDKTELLINNNIKNNKKILCEGAQGTYLDIDFGTYPYVTSSSTLAASACTGLGVSPKQVNKIFGVTKCYTTRVGNGEFLTELHDDNDLKLKIVNFGNEWGSTTGRQRRVGWLNFDELEYAIMLNGVTDICLTKYDVLCNIGDFKVYYKGKYLSFKTCSLQDLEKLDINNLPKEIKEFVEFTEKTLNVNVTFFSYGKERHDILKLK